MKKQISLNLTHIKVRGSAVLNLWGGGQGKIKMDSVLIPVKNFNKTAMLKAVNDGGFGCQSIESAEIHLFLVYNGQHGYEVFDRIIEVNHPIHTKLFLS